MALDFDNPYVLKGDRFAQLRAWRVESFSDKNTDRGRVYPRVTFADPTYTVELYKHPDLGAADLVASGSGSSSTRISLTAMNDSEFGPSSVFLDNGQSANGRVLFLALATQLDLEERDNRLRGLLLEDEVDFSVIMKATSREFLTLMSARFPPSVSLGSPLRFMGGSPLVPQGKHGDPDQVSAESGRAACGRQSAPSWRGW